MKYFLFRAYLNHRLDLTEAEGLIDLINAQTEQQRKQSLYQMQGSLKELYERWRLSLVQVRTFGKIIFNAHAIDPIKLVIGTCRSLY